MNQKELDDKIAGIREFLKDRELPVVQPTLVLPLEHDISVLLDKVSCFNFITIPANAQPSLTVPLQKEIPNKYFGKADEPEQPTGLSFNMLKLDANIKMVTETYVPFSHEQCQQLVVRAFFRKAVGEAVICQDWKTIYNDMIENNIDGRTAGFISLLDEGTGSHFNVHQVPKWLSLDIPDGWILFTYGKTYCCYRPPHDHSPGLRSEVLGKLTSYLLMGEY